MRINFLPFIISAIVLSSCSSNSTTTSSETTANSSASLHEISGVKFAQNTPYKKEGKKVLVVSASPRKGGNTDLLSDQFAKGATEAGGKVEKIFLPDYKLDFLSEEGANNPKETGRDTETWKIVEKFLAADVVCLAAPTYYMNVNDRMKTFIDATYLAFGDERMANKEFYYITACADADRNTAEWCFNGFRGFVMCLPKPTERGSVAAIGIGRAGAVKGTQYETEAYELGLTINK